VYSAFFKKKKVEKKKRKFLKKEKEKEFLNGEIITKSAGNWLQLIIE